MSQEKLFSGEESFNEEEEEFEVCLLELSSLELDQYVPKFSSKISQSIQDSLEGIHLKRKGYDGSGVRQIYCRNIDFLSRIIIPIFWYVDAKLYHSDQIDKIKEYSSVIGDYWGKFHLPLDTDPKILDDDREFFYISFPYFCTQTIQELFIIISHGNPEVTSKSFRMLVCRECVSFFSGVSLTEDNLLQRLGRFFYRPPPSDILRQYAVDPKEKSDMKLNMLLPVEDLSTLVETEPRIKPENEIWSISGLSPIMKESTGHNSVPFEPEGLFLIQHLGNKGDKLPPLLPSIQIPPLDRANYNPLNEPRSLLHRSLRPNLTDGINAMKEKFKENEKAAKVRCNAKKKEIRESRKQVYRFTDLQQEMFFDRLRKFQLEKKRDESPGTADIIKEASELAAAAALKDKEKKTDKGKIQRTQMFEVSNSPSINQIPPLVSLKSYA